MGVIRELSTDQRRVLEPDHVLGRALTPMVSQTVNQPYVSGVHAEIRWTGREWVLKDLNSLNGTYLDGRRMTSGSSLPVRKGSRLAFGKREHEWEVIDDSSPEVMAVPLDTSAPVRLEGDMIALPSSDEPIATIYRGEDGGWVLEHGDEPVVSLANGQVFNVLGRLWRFWCSDMPQSTIASSSMATVTSDLEVERLHLTFAVSRDEEHVHVKAKCGDQQFDLGARAFHYLLVTLARRRKKDAEKGLPEPSCGWIDLDDLAHDRTMAPPQLNIDVYRIRQQFAKLGVLDAPKIIQRRARARQLRIGTGNLLVEVL